jgi:hypothetical protein
MVNTEFWYAEGGSRAEGRNNSGRQSKRWWLPSPQVPKTGLSDTERKKLLHQGRVVHQVFKAAKSINENVLLEMPVPAIIQDALPKVIKLSHLKDSYLICLSNIFVRKSFCMYKFNEYLLLLNIFFFFFFFFLF